MTAPEHSPEPLVIEIVPAPAVENDPPGQVRVGEIWVNGRRAVAPEQLVFVGTEIRQGEPLLVNLQVHAHIVTADTPSE